MLTIPFFTALSVTVLLFVLIHSMAAPGVVLSGVAPHVYLTPFNCGMVVAVNTAISPSSIIICLEEMTTAESPVSCFDRDVISICALATVPEEP